jgi:hypothetical protein
LLLIALLSCVYKLVPDDRICEDVGYAISERTLACQDDEELALARYHEWEDRSVCLLSSDDPPEDNPDGILPMVESDYGAETARLERLYSCVAAIGELDCTAVERRGDELAWWLSAAPACDGVAEVPL